MRSIEISSPGEIVTREDSQPDPGPAEVELRVELVGVCATDKHLFEGDFPGAGYPLRPGHEVVGIVSRRGARVTDLAVGDRVVIDPALPCQTCRYCRAGRANQCERRGAYGITRAGGAAEYLIVLAAGCHPVPAGVSARTAVLAEPAACVVHALDLVPEVMGSNVLIYGAGAIGLLAAAASAHRGAHTTTVVDLNRDRLAAARELGVEVAVTGADDADLRDWDLVIDATGVGPAIADGLGRLARGGALLQLGVATPSLRVEYSPYLMFERELRIVGSKTTRFSFPRALAFLSSGAVDAEVLTSQPHALAEYPDVLRALGTAASPKTVIDPRR